MTIELCSNFLQLLVTFIAAFWATIWAVKQKTVIYTLVAGALDTFALGILYWFTYQYITDVTPQIFYVADLSWIASILFLMALELYLTEGAIGRKQHFLMYIPALIIAPLTVYFCQWGDVLLNIVYMIVLSLCGYLAVGNILFGDRKFKLIHMGLLVFIATEYALWLSSCFWVSDTWTNPYFWFDFLLTVEIGLFLPLVRRVVDG